MKKNLRILSLVLVLLTALALVACGPAEAPDTNSGTDSALSTGDTETYAYTVTVDVVGSDGKTTSFTIKTNAETLRGALDQEKLVQGEEGPYGLYIKTVNGETADFDTDGAYWAVYEGDQMAMAGVEGIKLTNGGNYKLVYTKG